LGLALDEPKDTDDIMEQDGLKFLVDRGLTAQTGEIKVDFIDAGPRSGFSISSKIPLSGGCSSGSCSSGSCG
jgi:Fe-S cluster assembly iron-binding protein IscA